MLNDEQREVLRLVLAGRNVFFTGCAGTGKSLLLEHVVLALRARYGGDEKAFRREVAVTATTGVAACNVGGQTLNSALGVGVPTVYRHFDRVMSERNRARVRRWRVLVIDEVSMLSAEFLEQMDRVLRKARGVDEPAGGLQLVLSGDFHQVGGKPPRTPSPGCLGMSGDAWGCLGMSGDFCNRTQNLKWARPKRAHLQTLRAAAAGLSAGRRAALRPDGAGRVPQLRLRVPEPGLAPPRPEQRAADARVPPERRAARRPAGRGADRRAGRARGAARAVVARDVRPPAAAAPFSAIATLAPSCTCAVVKPRVCAVLIATI